MAKALTTSEAVKVLLDLGYENRRTYIIKDNFITERFGKSNLMPQPRVVGQYCNPFTKQMVDTIDPNDAIRYEVAAIENTDGKSYIYIYKFCGNSGHIVCSYINLKAKEKKALMEILVNEFPTMVENTQKYWASVKDKMFAAL